MKKYSIVFFIIILANKILFSQTEIDSIDINRKNFIKLYLDCDFCDIDYIRENIPFVDFVRMQQEADVHLLSTDLMTASRGSEYSFFFVGQNKFLGLNDTLKFVKNVNETYDELRLKSTNLIKAGLIKYLARTPLIHNLKVEFENPEIKQEAEDVWNNWFFRISTNFYTNGEQSYSSISNWSSFNVSRITNEWKYEFDIAANYNSSTYRINDTFSIKSSNVYYGFTNLIVRSLGEHWSIGENFNVFSSEYRNIKLGLIVQPALEFNIYPFSQATRRQFRFLYGIGFAHYRYYDTTIYLKTKQFLYLHSLNSAFEQIETWGSLYLSIKWQNYLHNFKLNNMNFYTQINLRILKGLSFNVGGGLSLVHDQINLPKRGASYEEILTRQRQLESQYEYWISAGFSYSFGSIYNNIVNPRFEL